MFPSESIGTDGTWQPSQSVSRMTATSSPRHCNAIAFYEGLIDRPRSGTSNPSTQPRGHARKRPKCGAQNPFLTSRTGPQIPSPCVTELQPATCTPLFRVKKIFRVNLSTHDRRCLVFAAAAQASRACLGVTLQFGARELQMVPKPMTQHSSFLSCKRVPNLLS